ncbi:MAG: MBL fold metallo-hydrolase [Myxococcota bacterium]
MQAATPRRAAALLLRDPDGRILLSKRNREARFLGGFVAFVGGGVDEGDAALAVELFGPSASAEMATVVRELHEETALLLTDKGAVEDSSSSGNLLESYAETGHRPPPASALAEAGRWITPDYLPIRFDTRFYLVDVETADAPRPDPRELEAAWFELPGDLLRRHRGLEVMLSRPTLDQLEGLASGRNSAAALAALPGAVQYEGDPSEARPFEPVRGIWVLPLRTPTLPPATHTNCYVVGHEQAIIVDPATYDDGERARLGELLDERSAQGMAFAAVVLTHHHRDHIGSAQWVAHRLSIPIWGHPTTRDLLAGEVHFDGLLEDGDTIDLGRDPSGHPFVLRCLHTPGHAAGHLVLVDEREGSPELGGRMIVGDMVAAVGTIIVDPDEGHMTTYLEQLRRLAAHPDGVLFPAHGPPIAAGRAKLEHYIAHRLAREAKVRAALEAHTGPATPQDLLPAAYADTPPAVWPLAERACLAHLDKLVEDGVAGRSGGRFVALPS